MAIADVAEYAHLSEADIEALAAELEAIRRDIEDSRGARDSAYIRRAIAFQRCLEVAARLALGASSGKAGWAVGTAALAVAKSIENMELAHNIGHGQWDWMNDPEIHSTTWEWDMVGPSSQWRYSHNYRHHVFTNVVGMDDDLGYGVLRVTRDQRWKPSVLLSPLRNVLLAITFEWGIALHDLHSDHERAATDAEKSAHTRALIRKIARQTAKDYLIFPALSRTAVAPHPGRKHDRQPAAQPVGIRGDLLRALPGRRGEIHPGRAGGRDQARMVSATYAGHCELRRRTGAGVPERKPVLPDRTPPVPRPAQQPLRGDRPTGAGGVRHLRPALHDRSADQAIPAHPAHHLQTGPPGSVPIATSDDAPETASEDKFRNVEALHLAGGSDDNARRRGLSSAILDRKNRRAAS